MKAPIRSITAMSALALVQGCAALGGKTDVDRLDHAGVTVVSYEAESRGAYFANAGAVNAKYCAEPPPDIALDRALKATAKVDYSKIDAELGAELSSQAVQLAGRTQLVLLARELLYRTCEMSLNGQLQSEQVQMNYEKVIELIEKLGQAELKDSEAELLRQKNLEDLKAHGAELGDN